MTSLNTNSRQSPLKRSLQFQRGKGTSKPKDSDTGKPVIIVSGGFNGYPTDIDEINSIITGDWLPNSVDFRVTASDTVGKAFWEATDVDGIFGALSARSWKNF